MLKSVTDVKALPHHKLWLQFADGVSGVLSFADVAPFKGVFAALASPDEFAKVSVDAELGVVCWPGGQDLDSEVLYSYVTGKPVTLDDGTIVTMKRDQTHG